jgi:hypothetical protein
MPAKESLMLSLSSLKQWFKQKQNITMHELQLKYNEEPTFIYNMLRHFIMRGQLRESRITLECGSKCQQCNPVNTLKFEWLS